MFNGNECVDPGPIEGVSSMNKDVIVHRPIYSEFIKKALQLKSLENYDI